MTKQISKVRKVVVFLDVCSSTTILEDLLSSGNSNAWRDVLIATKQFLKKSSAENNVDIYKFIGDGWVLLFPKNISGKQLIKTLTELSRFFQAQLETKILPLLQSTPDVCGLTFGVDSEEIVRIIMLGQKEYIGRPLKVASRLQGAIKERDPKPAYKVLFTKHACHKLGVTNAKLVKRKLRNLSSAGSYECMKLSLRVPAKCK